MQQSQNGNTDRGRLQVSVINSQNNYPVEYSQTPGEEQPYSEYTVKIDAEGFEPKEVAGKFMPPGRITQ